MGRELSLRARRATGEWAYFTVDDILRHSQNVPAWVYENPSILKDVGTGLKDRNGKTIFEGDILATSNNDPAYDIWKKEDMGYTVVVWDDQSDMWIGSTWTWEKNDLSVYGIQFCEVIGNRYEHPDLVKDILK